MWVRFFSLVMRLFFTYFVLVVVQLFLELGIATHATTLHDYLVELCTPCVSSFVPEDYFRVEYVGEYSCDYTKDNEEREAVRNCVSAETIGDYDYQRDDKADA